MNYFPVGFTDISLDFIPLTPPPAITALAPSATPSLRAREFNSLISSQQPGQDVELQPGMYIPLLEGINWQMHLSVQFIEPNLFQRLRLRVRIVDSQFQEAVPANILVAFRIIDSVCGLVDDLPPALYARTNNDGVAEVIMNLSFILHNQCSIFFVAHPFVPSDDKLPLLVAREENLPIRSNIEEVKFVDVQVRPATPGVGNIPLEAPGLEIINDSIEEQIVIEDINNYDSPQADKYNDAGFANPFEISNRGAGNLSFQFVQGFTKNQACRFAGWSADLFHNVHSHLSIEHKEDSEITTIERIVKTNSGLDINNRIDGSRYRRLESFEYKNVDYLKDGNRILNQTASSRESFEDYKKNVEASGSYTVSIAATRLPDTAKAITNIVNNNIVQYNAHNFRIQASAVFDVQAASTNFVSTHFLFNGRWLHFATDTVQASHKHIWSRASQTEVRMSGFNVNYAVDSAYHIAAKSWLISGPRVVYQDVLWNQTGQLSEEPLHPTRSTIAPGQLLQTYGTAVHFAMKNIYFLTHKGDVVINPAKKVTIVADEGAIALAAPRSGIHLYAFKNFDVVSKGSVNIHALKSIAMDAGRIYINSHFGSEAMSSPNQAFIPVIPIPKEFSKLNDLAPLEQGLAGQGTGPLGSNGFTDFPSQIVGGPESLGRWTQ